MRDKTYLGELMLFSAIAGALSALLKSLVHHAFVWLNLSTNFYQMLTAFFAHGHLQVKGFPDWVFSQIGDITIGGLLGILLAFWLKASRQKYHWWIGFGYGVGIWFISLAFGNLANIIKAEMTSPWSLFAHLLAMQTYALLFVLLSRIWGALSKRLEIVEGKEEYEGEDNKENGDDEVKETEVTVKKPIKI